MRPTNCAMRGRPRNNRPSSTSAPEHAQATVATTATVATARSTACHTPVRVTGQDRALPRSVSRAGSVSSERP